jgi:hypothetical protein
MLQARLKAGSSLINNNRYKQNIVPQRRGYKCIHFAAKGYMYNNGLKAIQQKGRKRFGRDKRFWMYSRVHNEHSTYTKRKIFWNFQDRSVKFKYSNNKTNESWCGCRLTLILSILLKETKWTRSCLFRLFVAFRNLTQQGLAHFFHSLWISHYTPTIPCRNPRKRVQPILFSGCHSICICLGPSV